MFEIYSKLAIKTIQKYAQFVQSNLNVIRTICESRSKLIIKTSHHCDACVVILISDKLFQS